MFSLPIPPNKQNKHALTKANQQMNPLVETENAWQLEQSSDAIVAETEVVATTTAKLVTEEGVPVKRPHLWVWTDDTLWNSNWWDTASPAHASRALQMIGHRLALEFWNKEDEPLRQELRAKLDEQKWKMLKKHGCNGRSMFDIIVYRHQNWNELSDSEKYCVDHCCEIDTRSKWQRFMDKNVWFPLENFRNPPIELFSRR